MRPSVTAPFTVYCEEHAQELAGQLDGQVIQAWGKAVPVSSFMHDIWQSAKREGYIEGHVQAQVDLYGDEHGHGPPAGVVGAGERRPQRRRWVPALKELSRTSKGRTRILMGDKETQNF
jgi:hypothetical protein